MKPDEIRRRLIALDPEQRERVRLQLLQLSGKEGAPTDQPGLAPVPRDGPLCMSFAQQGLWLLDQLMGSHAYLMKWIFRLRGLLNLDALRGSLAEIVHRHEVLRTALTLQDGQPTQVVHSAGCFRVLLTDLSGLPPGARAQEEARVSEALTSRPIDLDAPPLFRAAIVRLAPEDHLLLLSVHHAVMDGWSQNVLWEELVALYSANSAKEPSPLTDLPLQYADYAAWQRDALDHKTIERRCEALRGAPNLELPVDRPRPPTLGSRGGLVRGELPETLLEELRRLGRREGTTLFTVLAAGFIALLRRYTDLADICLAAVSAGREHHRLERLIGMFANTILIRADLSDDPPLRELVSRVKDAALAATQSPQLPFSVALDHLVPLQQRQPSHIPLAPVTLLLQNYASEQRDLPGVEVIRQSGAQVLDSRNDLTFYIFEAAHGASCSLSYNAELFNEATIHRLLEHFFVLLRGATAKPGLPLSMLSVLTDEEHQALPARSGECPAPTPACLHELFAARAAQSPEESAAAQGGRTLTYGALARRAEEVRAILTAAGVAPGSTIAALLSDPFELLAAALGILQAGGAYVSLDPRSPAEETEAAVSATEATYAVVPAHHEGPGPDGAALIYLEGLAGTSGEADPPAVQPGATAAVIAGGRGEWIRLTHEAITRAARDPLAPAAGDDMQLLCGPATPLGTFALWGALLNGARLRFGAAGGEADRDTVAGELPRHDESAVVALQAPLFEELVGRDPGCFAGLLRVLVGGRSCAASRLRDVLERGAPQELHRISGPPQTLGLALGLGVVTPPPADLPLSVGRPRPGVQVHVLDNTGQPTTTLVAGTLWISAPGLVLADPDGPVQPLPEAVGSHGGALAVRTGDRARFLADGSVEIVGREAWPARVGGYLVDPGAVEAALSAHAAIVSALVTVEAEGGDRALVAQVVPAADEAVTAEELIGLLRQRLPAHMIPARLHFLQRIPLGLDGDVDPSAANDCSVSWSDLKDPQNARVRKKRATLELMLKKKKQRRGDEPQ